MDADPVDASGALAYLTLALSPLRSLPLIPAGNHYLKQLWPTDSGLAEGMTKQRNQLIMGWDVTPLGQCSPSVQEALGLIISST